MMEFLVVLVMVLLGSSIKAYGTISQISWREISNINNKGPYIGIVVPNAFELNPLLQSSSFVPHNKFPYFDFAGRHFRIGELEKKKVIVVMTGESMLNAGLATQLLLALFNIEGVLHYGIAGNVNSKFQIGDVTIPTVLGTHRTLALADNHWRRMEFLLGVLVMIVLFGNSINAYGAINQLAWREISNINNQGPSIGIVVPNAYELNPLLHSSSFVPHNKFPYFDFAGRHFRIGELEKKKVIVVMSGEGMLNAGLATQLLLTLFNIEGVLHYGIAGNLNSRFQIGDVTIPKYWAHTGLWHWQRFGEDIGDFGTEFGYLKFSNYNNYTKHSKSEENLLNKVWYQPERIFPVDGTPEVWQPAFWVPVDKTYFEIARKLKNVELSSCVNTTCLPRKPIVVRVKKGVSANIFVDNKAYRDHLNCKFDATPVDMESAAVALVCFQHKIPFIAIRALSDFAGGGSELSNEASIFLSLASQNAFHVLVKFISLL